jgi:hypothetical protein
MWNESGAATGDFTRIIALARSQYVLFYFSFYHVVHVHVG